jgi:hypothetical protein
MHTRLYLFGFIAGTAWGVLAYLLGSALIGPDIWAGVLASPFIGPIVSRVMHPRYARATGWRRALTSLGSLYLGAAFFGLALSFSAFARQHDWQNIMLVALVPWGITVTGYIIALWPLAHGTHAVIEWRMDQ